MGWSMRTTKAEQPPVDKAWTPIRGRRPSRDRVLNTPAGSLGSRASSLSYPAVDSCDTRHLTHLGSSTRPRTPTPGRGREALDTHHLVDVQGAPYANDVFDAQRSMPDLDARF